MSRAISTSRSEPTLSTTDTKQSCFLSPQPKSSFVTTLLRVAGALLLLELLPFFPAVIAVFMLQGVVLAYYLAAPLKSFRLMLELRKADDRSGSNNE